MSMHRIPLTPLEDEGLRVHGLDIGKPSQLSDVFRLGVAWALRPENHGLPPYPTDDVVGACVCGSWPGGKCLRCPVIPATPKGCA